MLVKEAGCFGRSTERVRQRYRLCRYSALPEQALRGTRIQLGNR